MAVPQRKYADNIIGFPVKRKPPINTGVIVAVFLVVLLAAGVAFVKDVSVPDQPLPETGEILRGETDSPGDQRDLPFAVIADPINHYVFKLSSEANELVFFVRKGEKGEIRVPEGTYSISWAYGTHWKGMDDLFGAQTECEEYVVQYVFGLQTDGTYAGWSVNMADRDYFGAPTNKIPKNKF